MSLAALSTVLALLIAYSCHLLPALSYVFVGLASAVILPKALLQLQEQA
jgi:hypothetical protein